MSSRIHPAVERIRAEHGHSVIELLEAGLSGADLTSLLLHVAEQRASALSATDVLAQRERDRFVQPALVDGRHMMRTELRALDSIAELFDVLTLSPLCPLGTHSVGAGVHQNRVITTARSTEVAADPTNGRAVRKIYAIKGRARGKGLPLIAASMVALRGSEKKLGCASPCHRLNPVKQKPWSGRCAKASS